MTHDDTAANGSAALATLLKRPLDIGGRTLPNRLVFAPMTFLGHIAFRELLSDFGGYGLLFSEMCSAKTVPTENRWISSHFRWRDVELSRLACQIVGCEPERMADAARRIEAEGFFGVDVNFGCSTTTICRRNCGAAVLRRPDLAGRIVECIRRAVSIPLTVKFRTGWQDDPEAVVRLGRQIEAAGADGVTFHPRVAPDRRARAPKWEYIGRLKQALRIPVFGNGNVFDADGCLRMLRQTGCDGVALGRIVIARPWTFSEWTDGTMPEQDVFEKTAKRLLELTFRHFEEKAAVLRFRKFIFYFAANFRFGHTLYRRVQNCSSFGAIQEAMNAFFAVSPELTSAPNMNYFQ